MATIEFEITEVREFVESLQKVSTGDFHKELEQWLEAIGLQFLDIVQDEITRREVVDSRLLLHSFEKGDEGNIWRMSEGDLTLEVGSSVLYAGYVEDGHRQQPGRFIPGHWEVKGSDNKGASFVYDPGAKEGMVLKASWVEGKHYFQSAIRILDAMFPKLLEAKFNDWLSKYLSF